MLHAFSIQRANHRFLPGEALILGFLIFSFFSATVALGGVRIGASVPLIENEGAINFDLYGRCKSAVSIFKEELEAYEDDNVSLITLDAKKFMADWAISGESVLYETSERQDLDFILLSTIEVIDKENKIQISVWCYDREKRISNPIVTKLIPLKDKVYFSDIFIQLYFDALNLFYPIAVNFE